MEKILVEIAKLAMYFNFIWLQGMVVITEEVLLENSGQFIAHVYVTMLNSAYPSPKLNINEKRLA